MLEFDDPRSGSFAPLRHVRDDTWVVLGLVSTKLPATASRSELLTRLEAAAEIVPRERLAISPQCGFSTSVVGNRIAPDDQKLKLKRVVETARAFW